VRPSWDPAKRRAKHLMDLYGLTQEEYEQMLMKQKGVCAICNKPQHTKRKGKLLPLFVDHCHKTGKVRGLLCNACNRMLGHADDNTSVMMAGIKYLEEHK